MQHLHASAPPGIELFIATSSPNDSLSLSWPRSESLPSDSDKTSALPSSDFINIDTMPSTVTCDQITALTELSYSNVNSLSLKQNFHIITSKKQFDLLRSAS